VQEQTRSIQIPLPLEIRWHGRGGQGAVTAAKLLAEITVEAGFFVQSFPQFGSERRGAPIAAFTRIDHKEITLYTTIQEPNVLIILDSSLLETGATLKGLQPEGLLLVNSTSSPQEIRAQRQLQVKHLATVEATKIGWECLNRPMPNIAILGALLAITKLFAINKVIDQLSLTFKKSFNEKLAAGNLQAFLEGTKSVMIDIG